MHAEIMLCNRETYVTILRKCSEKEGLYKY